MTKIVKVVFKVTEGVFLFMFGTVSPNLLLRRVEGDDHLVMRRDDINRCY